MGFTRADSVALMFCCTHKSLTLGKYEFKKQGTHMSILFLPKVDRIFQF